MFFEKKKNSESALSLLRNINSDLSKVEEVLELDIDELIRTLNRESDKNKEKIVCTMINNQLENLSSSSVDEVEELKNKVDELISYYVRKKENFDLVIKEGNYIADQLLIRVFKNDIKIPINISTLKRYFYSTRLKEKQFYDTLIWMSIRYVAISRCIMARKIDEEYDNRK